MQGSFLTLRSDMTFVRVFEGSVAWAESDASMREASSQRPYDCRNGCFHLPERAAMLPTRHASEQCQCLTETSQQFLPYGIFTV